MTYRNVSLCFCSIHVLFLLYYVPKNAKSVQGNSAVWNNLVKAHGSLHPSSCHKYHEIPYCRWSLASYSYLGEEWSFYFYARWRSFTFCYCCSWMAKWPLCGHLCVVIQYLTPLFSSELRSLFVDKSIWHKSNLPNKQLWKNLKLDYEKLCLPSYKILLWNHLMWFQGIVGRC